MDGTIMQQGKFTSDGAAKILEIRSDLDNMWVYNYTQMAANASSTGYKFYWQRGMADATGIEYQSNSGGSAVDMTTLASGGFTLIDSINYSLPARAALTGLTAANPAVITSAGHGLSVGDIVRFSNLDNQPQIAGIDFSVTASATTFTIGNINLTNSTASTSGYWRKIPYQPEFYPRRRAITYVSSASDTTQAKVYMSVTHGYTVGQEVRLQFPGGSAVWGNFAQLDGRACTVVAINQTRAGNEPNNGGTANNIVVDVDVSGLGNWNVFGSGGNEGYVGSGAVPFSPAQVVPFGEDTAQAISSSVDMLSDATVNTGYIGMQLGAGVDGPAGQANDVIYWVANKSFSVSN